MRSLAREAQKVAKSGMPKKADREKLAFLAMRIAQDIEINLAYGAQCMDEKMEKNIAHAKAEIESFVDMKFKNAGIEHFKGETPKLLEE